MNSLGLNKIKTITVYSRHEIISYFNQLKSKINAAYEKEDIASVEELVNVLRITLLLKNVTSFIVELNAVGDIQVTSYLEALLVKNSMWTNLKTFEITKNTILQLLHLFQSLIKTYQMPPKFAQLQYKNQSLHFSIVFSECFDSALLKKDIQFLILLVDWFKVKIITEIHLENVKNFELLTLEKGTKVLKIQWVNIVKVLIKYCRIIQNIQKQQIAISICYYLCTNEKLFIKQCIDEGAINILKRSLTNKNISESYGLKIINFLKLLISQDSDTTQFTEPDFEHSIVKFSRKTNDEKTLMQIRELLNLNEIKNKLTHKQKLQTFKYLSEDHQKYESQLVQNIHLLGLYAQNDKISDFVFNSESDTFFKLIKDSSISIGLFKEIFSAFSYIFSIQKGELSLIQASLNKLVSLLQSKNESATNILKNDRKRLLIDFIRLLKQILHNKKYFKEIVKLLKQKNIEKLLTLYSDCTNFVYEKELLQFKLKLNTNKNKKQQQDLNAYELINALQKHIVLKQSSPAKKLPGEDQLAEIKLLYHLICHNLNQANINSQTIQSIANKMYLQINGIQNEKITIFSTNDSFKINDIKKEINIYSIKLLHELMKLNETKKMIENQDILIKIAKVGMGMDDLNVFDNVILFVIVYLQNFKTSQKAKDMILELWKKALEMSKVSNSTEFLDILRMLSKTSQDINISPEKILQNYLEKLKKNEQISSGIEEEFLTFFRTIQQKLMETFLKQFSQIQPSKQNILQYIKIVYEFSKCFSLKSTIFKLFAQKLKTYYAQQIQFPSKEAEMIKNKIYLILKELIEINYSQNQKYFQDFLKITLKFQYNQSISKEQLTWVQSALSQLKDVSACYIASSERQNSVFEFVETFPQIIGTQCAILLQNSKKEEQFLQKHVKYLLAEIDKQNNLPFNLNFFFYYSAFCQNQTFQTYRFINVVDKGLQVARTYLASLQNQLGSENDSKLNGEMRDLRLKMVQKRTKIMKNFVCNESIILNENEYQHCVREIIDILESNKELIIQLLLINKTISQKNKQTILKILFNLLQPFIHILKTSLRSKQLSEVQQRSCSKFISAFIELRDKNINEWASQLLRLMMLNDKERKYYNIQKQEAFDKNYHQLSEINTERGQEHLSVCRTIIGWGQEPNKKEMNKMIADYFLIEMEQKAPNQPVNRQSLLNRNSLNRISRRSLLSENEEVTDSQLLRHLKALVNPPYTYGINIISKFLRPVHSKQYVDVVLDVFVISSSLYDDDIENKTLSLSDLRKSLIDTVLEEYCDLNERFYVVINMGKEGAALALKRKNIGKRGIQIICQKLAESKKTDDCLIFVNILTENALTMDELSIIHDYKIPPIVNQLYNKQSLRSQYCVKLGNFIAHTSKLQQNQEQYAVNSEIIENLTAFRNNLDCISATFNAISGLVYCNAKNQKHFGTKQNLQKIIGYCANQNSPQNVIEKGFKALANIVYKNIPLMRTYFDIEIDRKTMKMLSHLSVKQSQQSSCIKQILRLVGIIALSSEGSFKLTAMRYLSFAEKLFDNYIKKKDFTIVNLIISVIFNITNQTQNCDTVTIKKLNEQKVVHFILLVGKQCIHNGSIIECCLQTLQNLLNYEFILSQTVGRELLQLMQRVTQTQQSNQVVFIKWFRLLYLIYKNETKIVEVTLSNILYCASSYMRAMDFIEDKILEINMALALKIKDVLSLNELLSSGWLQFIIETLKAKNHTQSNLSKLLDILIQLTQKNLLSSFVNNKLFEILIKRLQFQYSDENNRKLIFLLKKIKTKATISSQTAMFLLQFSCFFLTQREMMLSPKYHQRVIEVISLLAYFITFNIELKIVFRDPNLQSILRDWIKVDTLIQHSSYISESCRLLLFAIYNEESTLMTGREDDLFGENKARDELQKGLKCTLYRRDGSSKSAFIKFNKDKNQIVAYKLPKGEIKSKYILPLSSILVLRSQYEEDSDILYNDSVFSKDNGLFGKKQKSQTLMTLIGMVGQDLSIREINVQFSREEKKVAFAKYLRLIITAENQKRLRN